MNLKNYLLLTLCIALPLFVKAQEKAMDFGKVPSSDVEMQTYGPEPDAEAVVLGHTLDLNLEFSGKTKMFYTYHKRIKIFNESAYDLANVRLYYYAKGGLEDIKRLKAIITYPDGSSYKLSKGEFYKEEYDDRYESISFTFPKLSEGCIIEYKYDLVSTNISVLEDFTYQEKYPVRYAHIDLDIPSTIDYVFINKGANQYANRNGDLITMDSIPSMKAESYVTTMDDYRATLKMQVRGYTDGYGAYHPVLSSWEKITEDLEESNSFGEQYLKSGRSNNIVKDVKSKVDKDLQGKELYLALQEAILDKVKCNYESGLYSPEGIENAWKLGEGSCTELNFMMVALLRAYDIEAYPMLISKRSNGRVFSTYPFINQFSYAIVYAKVGDEEVLMDISDKHRPPGMVSFEALNREGFVVNSKETGGWKSIPAEKSMDAFFCKFQVEDAILKGSIEGKYTSYNALPERRLYEDEEEGKHWTTRIQKKFPEAEVLEVDHMEGENIYSPFKDKLEVEIPDACISAGDLMYIDPFVYSNYTENPFKLTKRLFPVDFGNPRGEHYVFMLDIPEGYEIEEIPESTSIVSEDRQAKYQMTCKQMGTQIMITRKIEFNKPIYGPGEYGILKQIFDMLLEKDGEQIVLKKV